jgi:hypothetical protein
MIPYFSNRSKSTTKKAVTKIQNFGFGNIPNVGEIKELKNLKAQEYVKTAKKNQKPLFFVSTRKRPNEIGKLNANITVRKFEETPKQNQFEMNSDLIIENFAEEKKVPLINEIFLIDPQTNQIHSIIRQFIPSGDKEIGELAFQQLKKYPQQIIPKTPPSPNLPSKTLSNCTKTENLSDQKIELTTSNKTKDDAVEEYHLEQRFPDDQTENVPILPPTTEQLKKLGYIPEENTESLSSDRSRPKPQSISNKRKMIKNYRKYER